MKKTIAILLSVLMLAALLSGCGKTDPISGKFYATSCTDSSGEYECFGEYLQLASDGTGTIMYNGTEYTLKYNYSAEDGSLRFKDSGGIRFEGRCDGSSVTGTYGGLYEYRYDTIGAPNGAEYADEYQAVSCIMNGEKTSCKEDRLTLNADGTGTATLDGGDYDMIWLVSGTEFSMYGEDFEMTGGRIENGEITGSCFGADYVFSNNPPQIESGRYGATACTDPSDTSLEYYLDGEYLTINDDGTGAIFYGGSEYAMEWEYDGESFTFEDVDGDTFAGTYADGVIDGVYGNTYRYVFQLGAQPVVDEREEPAEATPVQTGVYGAVACVDPEDDTIAYYLDGEYIEIKADGTGTINFAGTDYAMQWGCENNVFAFKDEDGDTFIGSYADGVIDGVYGNTYRYVFQLGAQPVVEERE